MAGAFHIGDVADLLGIRRLGNGDSFGVICPYCGDRRGKMNFCIRKDGHPVNAYHCFSCGASGNMLTLYADMSGITGQDRYKRAYHEIGRKMEGTGISDAGLPAGKGKDGKGAGTEGDRNSCEKAPAEALDAVYRTMLSFMRLENGHLQKLKDRGLQRGQIEGLHARSLPEDAGEGERIARLLLSDGFVLRGVPGFYKNRKKNWDIAFPKASGFLFPVPDENGFYCAIQIRMDTIKDGRKYLWLSGTGYPEGVSSRSPAAFWGNMEGERILVTEGGLKAYCAWCFTGSPCIGIAGVGQAKSLEAFLQKKEEEELTVYECMDMDKFMPLTCDHMEKHCRECEREGQAACPAKMLKRTVIREGCNRLYGLCKKYGVSCRRVKWHTGVDDQWDGECKGIDDYLLSRRLAMKDAA